MSLKILALSTIRCGKLLAQLLDLAVGKLEGQGASITHGMELLDGLGGDEQLHGAINKTHDGGHVDEELLLEELRVGQGKDADGLLGGGLDGGALAEEADGQVVVDLEDLVRVLGGRDALGGGREVELLEGQLHQRGSPFNESGGGVSL